MSERMYYSKDAEHRAQIERSLIAVFFLGIGLSLGTALAMLFAPDKGENIREDVSTKANEFLNNGRESANTVWKNVRDRAEEGIDALSNN